MSAAGSAWFHMARQQVFLLSSGEVFSWIPNSLSNEVTLEGEWEDLGYQNHHRFKIRVTSPIPKVAQQTNGLKIPTPHDNHQHSDIVSESHIFPKLRT